MGRHKPCNAPMCAGYATDRGYCEQHQHLAKPRRKRDRRPAPSRRGYGREWQTIRREVLRDWNIPQEDWPLYDVDHRPRYDPAREPDHRKYQLVPMLRSEHSRKTVRHDGGLGHRKE